MNNKSSPRYGTGAGQISLTNSKPNNLAYVKAQASGNWKFILTSLGVPDECLTGRHTWCPIERDGKDRFRFTDYRKAGNWICNNCGSGDGIDLLKLAHGWDFKATLDKVMTVVSPYELRLINPSKIEATKRTEKAPSLKVARYNDWLWQSSKVITEGCIADLYLKKRAINLEKYPDCLRWHEELD